MEDGKNISQWQANKDLANMEPSSMRRGVVAYWIAKAHPYQIRAEVMDDKRVVLQPFDDIWVDVLPTGDYTLGTEPMWVTDRLMALGLMEIPPPPRPIEGVGIRMSATVFWIIAPTKEK